MPIYVRTRDRQKQTLPTVEYCGILLQPGADGENHIRVGKLNMVDLAGSERQAKTGATVSTSLTYNGVINSFIKTKTFAVSFVVILCQ